MKKSVKILGVVLVAGITCTVAGCSQNRKNLTALSSNWYSITSYKQIQPTFDEGNELFSREEISYKVTFEKPAKGNSSYSVDYAEGVYTTVFYATDFDTEKLTTEEYREGYLSKTVKAYCYKTELNIPSVIFTCNGESKTFENESIVTECYFLPVGDYLRPLYSEKTVHSTTPIKDRAKTLDEAYKIINRKYESFYNYEGTEVISVMTDLDKQTDNQTTSNRSVDGRNTFFDSCELNIALRAMNLGAGSAFSQVFDLYSPEGSLQTFTASAVSAYLTSEEKTSITQELGKNGLYNAKYDENNNEIGLQTTAVKMTYGGTLAGVSQVYWFSAIENILNNTGRTTLLKISTPLSYNLGVLNYTLDSVVSTFWNE